MEIFILADEDQKSEILSISPTDKASITFASNMPEENDWKNYDAFFLLSYYRQINPSKLAGKRVYINEVNTTLAELNFPDNFCRINGWKGFLKRPVWEVATSKPQKNEEIFHFLNRKVILVKDEPGLISARVISMIVNEAFFALGEKVSSEKEIDMAMKLGTNYPYGPFEWAKKIGIEKIYDLLKKLSEKEDRYIQAPALKKIYSETFGMNL
ncbi:MAG: 3-hydroxyacyl-CoA dehydrogenase family protein [Ginsengibacter sp.]